MSKNACFTICAKNYLAQAITLQNSFKKFNPEVDFYIFISDEIDFSLDSYVDNYVQLDSSWIPNWDKMAFKYNVIEFSTSIKPFCFHKLFSENYNRVIYLDPDIYVLNSLAIVYSDYLKEKSIVLTPHYCNIQTNYTGAVTEEELLFVGIYNLGFIALRNNEIGNKVIEWWKNRLENKCFADKYESLHVDQKWIDFIPAFFPNEVEICHNLGINPAIWNLHERELILSEKNQYLIKSVERNEVFELLFFHFSGFNPLRPTLINYRHPYYNTSNFPSYIPLFEDYINNLFENQFEKFSMMKYSFNSFSDGEKILPIQRRIFHVFKNKFSDQNPFDSKSRFRFFLKKNNFISGVQSNDFANFSDEEKSNYKIFETLIRFGFKFLFKIVGVRYYSSLLIFLLSFARFENQKFLIKDKL